MSPDSASCSTRCGQRRVREAAPARRRSARRRDLGRRVGVGLLAAAAPHLAVLEHRASRRPGRPSRGRCRCRPWSRRASAATRGPGSAGSARPRRRSSAASAGERPSRRSRSAPRRLRHLVDGRRGDHQDAEQRTAARAAAPRRTACAAGRAAGSPPRSPRPHPPAGGRWRRRARAAGCRWRCGRCRGRRRPGPPSRRPDGRRGRCARGRACCASRSAPASAAPATRPCRPTRRRRCARSPSPCRAAATRRRPRRRRPAR